MNISFQFVSKWCKPYIFSTRFVLKIFFLHFIFLHLFFVTNNSRGRNGVSFLCLSHKGKNLSISGSIVLQKWLSASFGQSIWLKFWSKTISLFLNFLILSGWNVLFLTLIGLLTLESLLHDNIIGKWSETKVSAITPDVAGPKKFVNIQSINVFVLFDTLVGLFIP